jgi:hypothetical protein
MEVFFKIEDNALIHGIGEVATKSDTTYYAHSNDISYPATNRLVKISCDQLDQKYKRSKAFTALVIPSRSFTIFKKELQVKLLFGSG